MTTETPTHVAAPTAPFGSVFGPTMSVAALRAGAIRKPLTVLS